MIWQSYAFQGHLLQVQNVKYPLRHSSPPFCQVPTTNLWGNMRTYVAAYFITLTMMIKYGWALCNVWEAFNHPLATQCPWCNSCAVLGFCHAVFTQLPTWLLTRRNVSVGSFPKRVTGILMWLCGRMLDCYAQYLASVLAQTQFFTLLFHWDFSLMKNADKTKFSAARAPLCYHINERDSDREMCSLGEGYKNHHFIWKAVGSFDSTGVKKVLYSTPVVEF